MGLSLGKNVNRTADLESKLIFHTWQARTNSRLEPDRVMKDKLVTQAALVPPSVLPSRFYG
jgi:hypothetical protein